MLKADFDYCCRSGIQKALRRGDLDLMSTCIEALWADSKHRSWLQWRTPVLVVEEIWPALPLLVDLQEKVQTLAVKDRYKHYHKFLMEMTAMPLRTKDPDAMACLGGEFCPPGKDTEEMKKIRSLKMSVSDAEKGILRVSEEVFSETLERVKEDENAKKSLLLLRERSRMGGMWGDRVMMIATMVLVEKRGLDRTELEQQLHTAKEKIQKHGELKKAKLPWYVCDGHTSLGRQALRELIRVEVGTKEEPTLKGLTYEKLHTIAFLCEGSWNPPSLVKFAPMKEDPDRWESVWWPLFMKLSLPFGQYSSAKDVLALWKTGGLRELVRQYVVQASKDREKKYSKASNNN